MNGFSKRIRRKTRYVAKGSEPRKTCRDHFRNFILGIPVALTTGSLQAYSLCIVGFGFPPLIVQTYYVKMDPILFFHFLRVQVALRSL